MISVLVAVGVGALSVGYNWAYAQSIKAMAAGQAHKAALLDTCLYLSGICSLGALVYVGWWVIVPELLGQYLGTYLGARVPNSLDRHKKIV